MTTPTPPTIDPNDWAHARGHVDYPGHRFAWALEDDRWRAATGDELTRRCRWTDHGQRCRATAAAALNRRSAAGLGPLWWYYCADHLYGRLLHDGHVWTARLELAP